MSSTAPLTANLQVQLDGSGNGQVSTGPTGVGEQWTSVAAAFHCLDNTDEAIAKMYVGSGPPPLGFAGGSTWGSTGDSAQWSGAPVVVGQQIWCVWTGGTPGTTAYLSLSGTRTVA